MLRSVICGCLISTIAYLPARATTVFSISDPTAIVVAADGLVLYEPTPGVFVRGGTTKISVCGVGGWLLCGFAGTNPINSPDPRFKFKFDFQSWILTIKTKDHPSVAEFAKAIQEQSRVTFRNMQPYLKKDDFWKYEVSKQAYLLSFQIAGYTNGVAQRCNVQIKLNRQARNLEFLEPDCIDLKWKLGAPHISTLPGALVQNALLSQQPGTAQHDVASKLQPLALTIAGNLLPDSPRSIQYIVSVAATLVRVEGKFDEQHVGGTTSLGILTQTKRPVIVKFPALP